MLERIGDFYAYLLGWPILSKLHRGIFYLSARGLGLLNHSSERISGEHGAMRVALAGKSEPVVFDVGANEGRWLEAILAVHPMAQIHAFEPQPFLAGRLVAAFPNAKVNAIGLGHEAGVLELFDYADNPGSQHASLLSGVIDKVHGGEARSQRVSIGTIDEYCDAQSIKHIDFLKIDVEGFDLNVLRGARRMLAQRRVDAIQFEFTHVNIVGRVFMGDFFTFLSSGYRFYRVLPHGLLPLDLNGTWENEQFAFQNVLALQGH